MLLRKCASRLLPRAAAPSRGAPRGLLLRALSTASDAPKADDASPPEPPPEPPPPSAAPKGAASTMEFQAETKKLLDIVANSLYTDKEVFVRELVSNASDALEKRRHAALTSEGAEAEAGEAAAGEMQIRVTTDADANTLTIEDSGIGMTRDELIANLGTIARSGSRNFLQSLEGGQAAATNVIGQFGVGFYSVFMVADRVTVYSRRVGADDAYCWRSSGDGAYELSEAENVAPGTKIVIELKADEKSFASRFAIEQNIRKYSNFVGFPIVVDGERVNTVEAIWGKSKNEVTEEEHADFYRYVSQGFDEPRFTLHFRADAPVDIKAIFYVPQTHMEKWGMARQEPGVHLYSRKVLIQPRAEKLLPEWMRFLKGVVDSEDLPLNISRESMQDSMLMRKLNTVLSKRVIKFLQQQAKDDEAKYLDFFREFGQYIKEGVYSDFASKEEAAKLLRFESSTAKEGELISLDDYISRMVPAQDDQIYFLLASSRETALSSAYLESLKAKDVEVLLLYSTVDEFVMTNLMSYSGKSLLSAENAKLSLDTPAEGSSLSEADAAALKEWLASAVDGIKEVRLSSRLVDSPAIVVDHESAAMRKMMGMVEAGKAPELGPQVLEINGGHPIIRQLSATHAAQPELAAKVGAQLYANALIAAGLLDDPRTILANLNSILEETLRPHAPAEGGSDGGEAPKTDA
jgi:TNF receptor-associated protein 1